MTAQNRYTVDDRLVGSVIGRYRIKQVLDRGGMGALYFAEHMLIGKPVVIKLLRPELSHHEEMVARFFNEAKAASAIRHPGVIEIFDFGHHSDGRAYIVMEHLDGHSLAHRLHRGGRLPELDAAAIARSIASVLAAAHARGIVHRDLKPDNVFMVPDPDAPGGERIKVLDFGIAKLGGDEVSQTRTGAMMGTPAYMSPEQARGAGAVDARADLYSLGCVLYHMLAGRPPFNALGDGEVIAMQLHAQPRPLRELVPELSDAIERVTMSLLIKDPDQRTQSARDVVEALSAIVGAAPSPVLLRTPVSEPRPTVREPAATAPTEATEEIASWFAASQPPSAPPRYQSKPYESIPPVVRSRAPLIVAAIGAFAAAAMVVFALVRSMRDDGGDAYGPAPAMHALVPAAAPAPAPAPQPAPPPAPPPAVVEPAPEPPPVVAEPTPAPAPAPAPISHPHAVANRRPAARAAKAPKPTTSSPNGSPLEPDL